MAPSRSPQALCALLVLLAAYGALPSISAAAQTIPFAKDVASTAISIQYRHPSKLARYSRLQRRQDRDDDILGMINYHVDDFIAKNKKSRVVLAKKNFFQWSKVLDSPSIIAAKSVDLRALPSEIAAKLVRFPDPASIHGFNHEFNMLQVVQQWPMSRSVKVYGKLISTTRNRGAILMELVNHGSLYRWVIENGGLSERAMEYIARQIAEILYDLHAHNVAHRDVKLENFGVNADWGDLLAQNFDPVRRQAHVRLLDLGLACYRKDPNQIKNVCGTILYMAPELCLNWPDPIPSVTDAATVDVYAFGCLITYMHPSRIYNGKADNDIPGCQIIDPSLISNDLYALLEGMLQKNPRRRFTMQQVIESPWFKGQIQVADDVQAANRQAESMSARHKDLPAKTTTERVKSVTKNAPSINRSKATQPQSVAENAPSVNRSKATQPQNPQREVLKPATQLTKNTNPSPAKPRVQEKPRHDTPFANTLLAPGGATAMDLMPSTDPISLLISLLSGGKGA